MSDAPKRRWTVVGWLQVFSGFVIAVFLFTAFVWLAAVFFLPAPLIPLVGAAVVSSVFAYVARCTDRSRLAWTLLVLIALPSFAAAAILLWWRFFDF